MMIIADLNSIDKDPRVVGSNLNKMIDKLGLDETITRLAWLYDESEGKVADLVNKYFAGDFVDDKGVKGGDFFWGDL